MKSVDLDVVEALDEHYLKPIEKEIATLRKEIAPVLRTYKR
jgi:hypothetical protein